MQRSALSDSTVTSISSLASSVTPVSTATVHPVRKEATSSSSTSSTDNHVVTISVTGKTRTIVPPQDLGTFRTLVPEWETVTTPRESSQDISKTASCTSLNTSNDSSRNLPNLTVRAAREQFFLGGDNTLQTPSPGVLVPYAVYPPLSSSSISNSSSGSHRYASIDRLAGRSGIYDRTPSPTGLNSERKFTPFAPRDTTNGISSTTSSGHKSSLANSKSTETGLSSGLATMVHSSGTTSIGGSANGYTPAGPAKDFYFATQRGRDTSKDEALINGRKERSESLVRDSEINVGFSDLPNQIHRNAVKKGFEFTLMVVGESGLGKSTLINSLFLTDIYSSEYSGPTARASKTVTVETSKVMLKERNVNLLLTIVDTPGFGCSVDNSNCWSPLVDFIESRYEEYLNAESRLHRTHISDNRVHCCLYFLFPSGHSLKELDIECMKKLHDKVNIIPVIAKSDTLTPEEIAAFKKNVIDDIKANGIKVYEFPDADENVEPSLKTLKSRMPFAVVGSNYVLESASGERKRGRKYPWGVVEVENLDHCDFIALRNLLIRHYMLDLVDTTNSVHYENYRCRKLNGIGTDKKLPDRDTNNSSLPRKPLARNPLAQMEEEKKEHDVKMKKMEHDMEQVFESKVKEKMQTLLDSETELQKRHEQTAKLLEQQRLEMEERRAAFEKEKEAFDMITREMENYSRTSTMDGSSRENLDPKKKKKSLF